MTSEEQTPTFLPASGPGGGILHVTTTPSPGAGRVGFAIEATDATPADWTWLYAADFCAALASSFGLNIIAPDGASLGGEFSAWGPRRGVTPTASGQMLITVREPKTEEPATVILHGLVPAPILGVSSRGNATVTPVNSRVALLLRMGGRAITVNPGELLDLLIGRGLINRYSDHAHFFTRHLEDAAPAFEVLSARRSIPLSFYDKD